MIRMCLHCSVRRAKHGEITCSKNCERGLSNARKRAESKLLSEGFRKVPQVLNLWERAGIRVSLGQMLAELRTA
jgi:hypothetical protein